VCVCVCVCVCARACVMSLGQSHWLVFGQLYVQSSGAPAVGAKLQIMLIINHIKRQSINVPQFHLVFIDFVGFDSMHQSIKVS
jgi:hypothetical protein